MVSPAGIEIIRLIVVFNGFFVLMFLIVYIIIYIDAVSHDGISVGKHKADENWSKY